MQVPSACAVVPVGQAISGIEAGAGAVSIISGSAMSGCIISAGAGFSIVVMSSALIVVTPSSFRVTTASVAVMTYPTQPELEDDVKKYVCLRTPSERNVVAMVFRRQDSTDEPFFPVDGRVRIRSRRMAESTILYPGIRNKHCELGFARPMLWGLARFMGRVKAVILQLDLIAADMLGDCSAHGS